MTRYLNEELYCELRLRFSLKFGAQKIELLGSKERVSVILGDCKKMRKDWSLGFAFLFTKWQTCRSHQALV